MDCTRLRGSYHEKNAQNLGKYTMIDYAAVCTQEVEYIKDEIRPLDTTGQDDAPPDFGFNRKRLKGAALPIDISSTIDVHRLDSSSDWLQDALRTLAAIEKLPDNWDSNGAEAPNQVAIQNSGLVLTQLDKDNLKPSLIEPSTDDAVCIGFWSGSRYADVECFNDGEILAMTHDRGYSEPEIWEMQAMELPHTINKIRRFLEK